MLTRCLASKVPADTYNIIYVCSVEDLRLLSRVSRQSDGLLFWMVLDCCVMISSKGKKLGQSAKLELVYIHYSSFKSIANIAVSSMNASCPAYELPVLHATSLRPFWIMRLAHA